MIPLIIAAHNEEKSIEACLASLLEAAAVAERALPVRIEPVVAADRCTDRTEEIARRMGVRVERVSGGKVEAQRSCARPGAPFQLFSDADIVVEPPTLRGLCRVMLERPGVQAAYPPKSPLPPRRRSPLAWAVHGYSRDEGFQRRRTWFDGKCFALRGFDVPTREQLGPRAEALGKDRFYLYREGVIADDVYLSRLIVHRWGVAALARSDEGRLWYRNPETASGVYAYYRRIRRELERLDRLFPEMAESGRRFGYRRTSLRRWLEAPLEGKAAFALFRAVDACWGPVYAAERLYFQKLAGRDGEIWPVIGETKGLARPRRPPPGARRRNGPAAGEPPRAARPRSWPRRRPRATR